MLVVPYDDLKDVKLSPSDLKVYDHVKSAKNPIKISFRDVTFEVTLPLNKNEAKGKGASTVTNTIIKGVNGCAMPGEVLYIMGSSGAGKTSLLNILSDRVALRRGSRISGKVMINDTVELKQEVFGSVAGYVMQDDILFSHYSPR
jgi:ABC-type multidrug transport system ATPase subunit